MIDNPYAAPGAQVADVVTPGEEVQLATKWQRFGNLLIDTLGYYLLIFVVSFVVTLASPEAGFLLADYALVVSIGLMLAYYVLFEAVVGRTPGKLITGTAVVREDGTAPRLRQIVGRSLARLVPFEQFSCLGDPPVGWHDNWSGTRVVRTRPDPSLGPVYLLRNSDESPGPIRLGLN